jgi:hypothetical protein
MLKLNNLALWALALLPIALTAQTPVTSAAQTQTANGHRADEAAIEQVMKQYHAAILAHDGTTLFRLVPARCQSLAERSDRLRIRSGAGKVGYRPESPYQQLSRLREVTFNDTQKFRPGTQQSRDPHGWHYRGCLLRFCLQRRREGQQSRQRNLAAGQSG